MSPSRSRWRRRSPPSAESSSSTSTVRWARSTRPRRARPHDLARAREGSEVVDGILDGATSRTVPRRVALETERHNLEEPALAIDFRVDGPNEPIGVEDRHCKKAAHPKVLRDVDVHAGAHS